MKTFTFYLKKLVKFKTLSLDKKACKQALDFVKKDISKLPVFVREFSFEGFPSLLITTKKTKCPKILLAAHIDVVGGGRKVFQPVVKNGKLFGRGVNDMNFATASFLRLLSDFGKNLSQYDFGVLFTSDEELGGKNGTKKILENGIRSEFCVIPDGGQNWTVQRSAKGVLNMRVESTGKSGHGSRPWEGKNAIEKLTEVLVRIKKEFQKEQTRAKEKRVTINIGKIKGGKELNQIPEEAQAELNIRFPFSTDKNQIICRIKRSVFKIKNIKIIESQSVDGYKVDLSNRYFKDFIALVEKKTGRKIKFIDSFGSCDARYFIKAEIPVISLRPKGGGHHTEQEWIDLKSLNRFYEVLKEFVTKNAKL